MSEPLGQKKCCHRQTAQLLRWDMSCGKMIKASMGALLSATLQRMHPTTANGCLTADESHIFLKKKKKQGAAYHPLCATESLCVPTVQPARGCQPLTYTNKQI